MSLLNQIKSIRFVLTFWYSTLLAIAFVLFGASVYVYLQHLMETKLDQDLVQEVDGITQIIDLDRIRLIEKASPEALSDDVRRRIVEHFATNPFNYIVLLTSTGGAVLYESDSRVNQALHSLEVHSRTTVLTPSTPSPVGTLRVAGRRADPFVIRIAYTDQTIQSVLGHLVWIFAVLVPVMLFIAFGGGWVMAGLILRPIHSITVAANRITAKNLAERIPVRSTKDELGSLIDTMNGMIARLQASFDQIKQFSMNVAHELRTPLTILKGETELALSKPIPSIEMQELVTSYLEETIRMSRIVDDLLTLAKADAGQLPINREPVNIVHLVEEIHEDALLLSSGKDLHIQLQVGTASLVLGDQARLRQLFRIIITNAIQYTERRGSIFIRCHTERENAVITFEDTGIGIPSESLDKIFERFYRVDQARTRAKGGTGLGLSLAKWIVEMHNGSIVVESVLGKGSRFTVRLPLHSSLGQPS
jgi:two-component system, OmpR family, sensor kinase